MGIAQVLFLEDAVELVGDRSSHLLGDQVQARCQAVTRPQRPADQLDGLRHGGHELPDPVLLPLEQPEERESRQKEPAQGDHVNRASWKKSPNTTPSHAQPTHQGHEAS